MRQPDKKCLKLYGSEAYWKIIQRAKGRCEICGPKSKILFDPHEYNTFHIHHKDKNATNNKISNLILVCHKHHRAFHPPKTSRFIRLYGATQKEICKKLKCTVHSFCYYHQIGALSGLLKKHIQKHPIQHTPHKDNASYRILRSS